jgi:hypothetical protein
MGLGEKKSLVGGGVGLGEKMSLVLCAAVLVDDGRFGSEVYVTSVERRLTLHMWRQRVVRKCRCLDCICPACSRRVSVRTTRERPVGNRALHLNTPCT